MKPRRYGRWHVDRRTLGTHVVRRHSPGISRLRCSNRYREHGAGRFPQQPPCDSKQSAPQPTARLSTHDHQVRPRGSGRAQNLGSDFSHGDARAHGSSICWRNQRLQLLKSGFGEATVRLCPRPLRPKRRGSAAHDVKNCQGTVRARRQAPRTLERRIRRWREVHGTQDAAWRTCPRGRTIATHDKRWTLRTPEHVLNHRTGLTRLRSETVGGAQHDQIGPAYASVQQNDSTRLAMLDLHLNVHFDGFCRGAEVAEIGEALRGSSVKGLLDWHSVDDDDLGRVRTRQGEGLRKGGPAWFVNVYRAQHTRNCLHDVRPSVQCEQSPSRREQTTVHRISATSGQPSDQRIGIRFHCEMASFILNCRRHCPHTFLGRNAKSCGTCRGRAMPYLVQLVITTLQV